MGVFCSTVLPLMLASALLATHGHAQTTYDEVQASDVLAEAEVDQDASQISAYKLRRSIEGAQDLPVASWSKDLPTTRQNAAATTMDNRYSVSDSSRPDDSIAGLAAAAGSTAEIIQHASDRQRNSLAKAAEEERGSRREAAAEALEIGSLEDGPLDWPGQDRQMRRLLRGAQ